MLGTSVQCVNGNHGAWTLPSRNGNCSGDELDLRLAKSPSELGVAKTLTKTLPSVSRLRNFFENLNKEEESETQDTENGALKRGELGGVWNHFICRGRGGGRKKVGSTCCTHTRRKRHGTICTYLWEGGKKFARYL